jgi:DNA-binding response OmpR family regulator
MDGVFAGPGPSAHRSESVSLGSPEGPITVLIIDDNGRFRTALAGLLGRAGFQVHVAGDGLQGVRCARGHTPDVVITDIYMPGVGGLPTIAYFREQWPGVKIIAMSGADAPVIDLAQRSTALGADWFLQKPFEVDELLALIGRLRARASGDTVFP